MNTADEVVFVLRLALALGPLAVYFLGLGLVNSLAQPCVVRARADFVVLAIAVVPMVATPAVSLLELDLAWLAGLGLVLAAVLFAVFLPRRDAGWVIYNADLGQCRRLVLRACRRLGWSADEIDGGIRIAESGLRIEFSQVSWLRNVTVRFGQTAPGSAVRVGRDQLLAAVCREAGAEAMLPSPTGASLVVLGTALLALPMWYLLSNMPEIVSVVRDILFA